MSGCKCKLSAYNRFGTITINVGASQVVQLDNQALLNAELRSSANQYQENFLVVVNEIRSVLRRIENLES
jgi:hypothetical protein